MNHEVLRKIILEQHQLIKDMKIIPRTEDISEESNRIIVGIRRSGKTTMLYHLVKNLIKKGVLWNQIIYINFEDERLDGFSPKDLDDILAVKEEMSEKEGWFFFDEIQNIPLWEKFCRRMADSKQHVFITGSNARMLSREMESSLGGRYLSTLIFPYSFKELLCAKNIAHDKDALLLNSSTALITKAFDEYLHFGGFPENIDKKNKREYISAVYSKVLEGDIITRHEIRNPMLLRLMIKKIAESLKDTISYNRLTATMKTIGINTNVQTVIDYVSYAEDAYLLFPVRNWFSAFTEKESVKKHYFIDTGILSLFLIDKDPLLLENTVAVELYKQHPIDFDEKVFFVKSAKTGLDIDFYLPQEQTLIQVAYSLDSNSREREVNGLIKAKRLINDVKRFIILTSNEKETIDMGNMKIEVIPVYQWALSLNKRVQ